MAPCRAGKELALAARQEEELRLKRMVEQRQVGGGSWVERG